MTKMHTSRPTKEVVLVKPDNESEEYECWVTVPKLIGRFTRHGTQRITTDDGGGPFTNHKAATRHLLLRAGETEELIGDMWVKAPGREKKIKVSGIQISMQGKWKEFCALFQIDPSNQSAVKKLYPLTQEQIDELGLEGIAG